MNYKKTYVPASGYTPLCKIGECSLKMLEFGIIELKKNESVVFETGENEVAFILLGGKADFAFDGTVWKDVGGRTNVFSGKAHSVYMPRHKTVTISTPWSVKIAVCGTPVGEDTEPEIITRGFIYVKESEELLQDLRNLTMSTAEAYRGKRGRDLNELKGAIRSAVSNYLFKATKRSPMVLPVITKL